MYLLIEKSKKKFTVNEEKLHWKNVVHPKSVSGFIYIISELKEKKSKYKNRPMKIGFSKCHHTQLKRMSQDEIKKIVVTKRYKEIKRYHHQDLYVASVSNLVHDVKTLEKYFHCLYRQNNISGEWFALNDIDISMMNQKFKRMEKLKDKAYIDAYIPDVLTWSIVSDTNIRD
jgi:hypothetical protein